MMSPSNPFPQSSGHHSEKEAERVLGARRDGTHKENEAFYFNMNKAHKNWQRQKQNPQGLLRFAPGPLDLHYGF